MEDRKNFIKCKLKIYKNYLDFENGKVEVKYVISDKNNNAFTGNTIEHMLAEIEVMSINAIDNGKVIFFDYEGDYEILSAIDFQELLTRLNQKYQSAASLDLNFKEILNGIDEKIRRY